MDLLVKLLSLIESDADFTAEMAGLLVEFFADKEVSLHLKAALTAAWKLRGERSEDLFQIASYIRQKKLKQPSLATGIADCCGTGGDQSDSFNISTATALVASSLGVSIAKHGGRKTTSTSGSVDFLEALGISTIAEPERIEKALSTHNLVFIASPALQNLLVDWKQVCRKLSFHGQTGLIGTLTNPLRLDYQLLGVSRPEWGHILVEVLRKQGLKRAAVVHSAQSFDELTTVGTNQVWFWDGTKISDYTFEPEDYGLQRAYPAQLKGGTPHINAQIFERLIDAQDQDLQPLRETIALNAGFLLWIAEKADSPGISIKLALDALQSGKVRNLYTKIKKN
ncbi:MAG: anthranilate phosphoribosyltransferase [Candidatus Caenarcaniphilales bacterium]|nr:anthranilate phosphoribosyltransferase [Candidatus Caenarcaniphilales bacterium]